MHTQFLAALPVLVVVVSLGKILDGSVFCGVLHQDQRDLTI